MSTTIVRNTTVPPGDVTTPAGVSKLLIYMFLAAGSILYPALTDNPVLSIVVVINAVIAALGVIPVYYVTADKWLKTVVAFAIAAAQALVLVLADGAGWGDVTIANWMGVVIAAFAAIGVAFVPNKPAILPDANGVYQIYTPQHRQ